MAKNNSDMNNLGLDEIQYNQCLELISNDAELRNLRRMHIHIMQVAIPAHVIVNQDTHDVQYIYTPEISKVKSMIELRIQERMDEIKAHFKSIKDL